MHPRPNNETDELTGLLSAAVLAPGLRSLLVFDAPHDELRRIAQAAAKLLETFHSQSIQTLTLQATQNDDALWGGYIPSADQRDRLLWQPGLLTPGEDDQIGVVLIPDLAQLSVTAARAAITLIGEQVASLERHGQRRLWRPGLFWIAGCATTHVGKVSAHLLDRFALRINRREFSASPTARVAELKELLDNKTTAGDDFLRIDDTAVEKLKTASQFKPQVDEKAIQRLLEYLNETNFYSTRRDLALARLAVAMAQLDHKRRVEIKHVDEAARIMGLRLAAVEEVETTENNESAVKEKTEDQFSTSEKQPVTDAHLAESQVTVERGLREQLVEEVDAEPEPFPVTTIPATLPSGPYPEDQAAIEREANPLRLPNRTSQRSEAASGPVIGTERATSLRDLALVRSLLEAAKFQPIRRANSGAPADQLILLPTDFHSYRREPIAEQMLVLVLDYTSLKDKAWEDALFPYIRDAYIERAMICFVKVGAADSRHELRAEKVEARSILVPSVAHALSTQPGRATPLAHGLDLAYQTLRRYLQHGRGGPYRATLVVVSDGRGNVPLDASRRGQITSPVLRRGFDDALAVAHQLRSLDYVRIFLLNPVSDRHPEMPLELATALGAQLREIQNQN